MMKKPKIPKKVKAPKLPKLPAARRRKAPEEKMAEALQGVPRITNETVAEHREAVLGSARKYIYPSHYSKRRIVKISVLIFVAAVIGFFAYCGLALYKFQSTSGFMYDVTRVVPFPVAKVGNRWVSYESYLFELRHNLHYYQAFPQDSSGSAISGAQLQHLKQLAMDQVIQDAYVKQLAAENHVSVSPREVTSELELVRSENRLGSNDRVFQDVLQEFWGWSEDDFRRELRQQLLTQKVVTTLDSATRARADTALAQLQKGADFAKVAKQDSDDQATRAAGGNYGQAITAANRDVAPQVMAELFKLKPGQISGIINTGYTLEIVKVLDRQGTSLHAAHISFNFRDISTYTKPLEAKEPPHQYIKF